jgi:hypothetical protein
MEREIHGSLGRIVSQKDPIHFLHQKGKAPRILAQNRGDKEVQCGKNGIRRAAQNEGAWGSLAPSHPTVVIVKGHDDLRLLRGRPESNPERLFQLEPKRENLGLLDPHHVCPLGEP